MGLLSQTWFVARKDLALEFRTKESLNAAGAFALTILLLFSFAFDPDAEMTQQLAGGLLWLVFAFGGALIFNRGFARELPNECLDVLLASPLSAGALVLGKALSSTVLLLVIEFLSLVVFGIFYNKRWWDRPVHMAALFVLGSWGISIVGAVFGALTVNLRLRELMLPVVIYPILIPLLMAAIELTNVLLTPQPLTASDWLWGKVLLVFDVVFTALSLALAEPVLVN